MEKKKKGFLTLAALSSIPVLYYGSGSVIFNKLFKTNREYEDKDICYLIAGKDEAFRNKILDNVSQNRKVEILEQEDILKPFRKRDCEAITSHFFSVLRRAYEEGHLIIKDRDDDVYV